MCYNSYMINKILIWLSGKKSVIISIILTTVGYLGTMGTLDANTVVYIGALVGLIFGTAGIATKEAFKSQE